MPPFPLLRLPRVVLCDVFKSLSIGEKIKLSLCSKRISTQINNARLYSQRVIIVLNMLYQEIRVRSENNKDRFDIFNCSDSGTINNPYIQQCGIEGHIVPVISFAKGITTFWKNHQEGFLSVIQHLLRIFQCRISISFHCHCSDLFQPTILKLFHLQLEFKKLTIKLNGSKEHNLLWNHISNKLGLVEDLNISSVVDTDFRLVFTSWPQEIYIMRSDWFTLEHLLACTCTKIILLQSHLRNNGLDEILKNWKAGGFPSLKYLFVESQRTNNGTTILSLSLLELRGNVIQTDDGLKQAKIKTDYGIIEMFVTPL